MGPRNRVLDGGPDPPCEGAILRGKGRPVVKCIDTAVSGAKTAEPIEMSFAMWTRVFQGSMY